MLGGRLRLANSTTVIPRACGVSSTPRPLDSIISVSGILDHPLEPVIRPAEGRTGWRVMTIESMARSFSSDIVSHSRGAMRPSCARTFVPRKTEGAGKAGCPLHPQPRVQCVGSTRVSSPQVHRDTRPSLRNGFNGFLRALPGDRACLPPSPADLACQNPVGPTCLRRLDASVGASGPHDFAVRSMRRSSARR